MKFINELGSNYAIRLKKVLVIFPELPKYSRYKDILETTVIELIYTNYGKEGIFRLQTLDWQLKYLNCFYDYLSNT